MGYGKTFLKDVSGVNFVTVSGFSDMGEFSGQRTQSTSSISVSYKKNTTPKKGPVYSWYNICYN